MVASEWRQLWRTLQVRDAGGACQRIGHGKAGDCAHISNPQAMEKMRVNGKNIPWYGSGQRATGRGITDHGRWRKDRRSIIRHIRVLTSVAWQDDIPHLVRDDGHPDGIYHEQGYSDQVGVL